MARDGGDHPAARAGARAWSTAPKEIEEAAAKLRCTPVRYLNVATKSLAERRLPLDLRARGEVPVLPRRHLHQRGAGDGAARARLALRRAVRSRARCRASTTSCPTWRRRWPPPARSTRADDVLFAELKELKYAYVVFDDHYYSCVDTTDYASFEANDVFPRGRYGSWIYNAMEDSILAGREVAREARRVSDADDAPNVSIVIPVYNEEGILHAAVVDLVDRARRARLELRDPARGERLARPHRRASARSCRRSIRRCTIHSLGEPNYGKALKRGHPARARRASSSATRSTCATPTSTSARSRILEHDAGRHGRRLEGDGGRRRSPPAVAPRGDAGDQRHAARAGRLPRHRHARAQGVPPRAPARHRRALRARRAICSRPSSSIRAERDGKRVQEIPIHIVEKRPPSINLFKRVPKVLRDIARLTYIIRVKG